jgi:hypothetical protein
MGIVWGDSGGKIVALHFSIPATDFGPLFIVEIF